MSIFYYLLRRLKKFVKNIKMKIFIICAGDRSNNRIALSSIKYLHRKKLDELTVCLLDKNKDILKFLKKSNKSYYIKF